MDFNTGRKVMSRYRIYLFDGYVSKYIKTLDEKDCDVQSAVDKMNLEYPEEDLIKGYGYYAEKERIIR